MSITLLIVIFTCLVSYYCLNNSEMTQKLKHYPIAEHRAGEYYRMLTSGFVHGSYWHLGINMFVLYEFGRVVERLFLSQFGQVLGGSIYLLAYLAMIVLGDIPTFLKHKDNPGYASIGASGATSGILFMYIIWSPWSMLSLYFFIPIPAIVLGVLYLWYSSWASKNQQDMIDHDAHLFGALAGVVLMFVCIPASITRFWGELVSGLPF